MIGRRLLVKRLTWRWLVAAVVLLVSSPAAAQVPGINVKSAPYNAVGDGLANDTAAFQAAYAQAKTSRAPLIIPPGNYRFTSMLSWDGPINVLGAGMRPSDPTKGVTLTKDGNFIGIKIIGQEAASAFYSGFTLDSTSPSDASNGIDIDPSGASGLRLDDVRVRHQGGHGIMLRSGNMEMFNNVVASENDGDGIHIESFTGVVVTASANAIVMRNVQATGNGGHGVNLARGDSHFISGLTTSGNASYGIRLNGITSHVQVDSFANTGGQILFDTQSIRNNVTIMHDTGMTGVVNNGENNLILDLAAGIQRVPIFIQWPVANPKPFDPDRMTTAARDALGNIQDGRLIFNTDLGVLNIRQFADWVSWPRAFDARLPLQGMFALANGTTAGRNLVSAEPSDGIGGGNNTPGAWWTWTVPCTFTSAGYMGFVDTSGSGINTIVGIFSGSSLGALSLLASGQNPTGGGGGSPIQITAGTIFQIRVRGASQSGAVRLRLRGNASGCAPFTDSSESLLKSPVKAIHVVELRQRVDQLRAGVALGPFAWTNQSLVGVSIKAVHIAELRTALRAAYTVASQPSPSFTDEVLTPQATVVKAVHIADLRAAVIALESALGQ